MWTPAEQIARLLATNRTDPKRTLGVAMEFARGMSKELRAVLSQWDDVVLALERLKAAANN